MHITDEEAHYIMFLLFYFQMLFVFVVFSTFYFFTYYKIFLLPNDHFRMRNG